MEFNRKRLDLSSGYLFRYSLPIIRMLSDNRESPSGFFSMMVDFIECRLISRSQGKTVNNILKHFSSRIAGCFDKHNRSHLGNGLLYLEA